MIIITRCHTEGGRVTHSCIFENSLRKHIPEHMKRRLMGILEGCILVDMWTESIGRASRITKATDFLGWLPLMQKGKCLIIQERRGTISKRKSPRTHGRDRDMICTSWGSLGWHWSKGVAILKGTTTRVLKGGMHHLRYRRDNAQIF